MRTGMARRRMALVAAAVLAGVVTAGGGAAGAGAVTGGSPWGRAREVPGTTVLNRGGDAEMDALSCASAGNCAAGGFYSPRSGPDTPFVASQVNGRWGRAELVPGTGEGGDLDALSCGAPGNCAAGGYYYGQSALGVFVVTAVGGRWGSARPVPGLAALNRGGNAQITAISCRAAGSCSAGGFYDSGNAVHAFVVGEAGGRWDRAHKVPGVAALGPDGSEITALSCAAPGECAAAGIYQLPGHVTEGFVVSQAHGTWGTARPVPGLAALNRGGDAEIPSISCPAAGECAAGGSYFTGRRYAAFVASQAHGSWQAARPVVFAAGLRPGQLAEVQSVSCGAPGECSAGGEDEESIAVTQAFVVTETRGRWGTAQQVPGLAALNSGKLAEIFSVSCGAPGDCTAGGYYDAGRKGEAFVAGQVRGTWGQAEELPGTGALNRAGDAEVTQLSCPSAGHCAAGGDYLVSTAGEGPRSGGPERGSLKQKGQQVFIDSQG